MTDKELRWPWWPLDMAAVAATKARNQRWAKAVAASTMKDADMEIIRMIVDGALQDARDRAIARRFTMYYEIFRAVRAVAVIALFGYLGFLVFFH